MFEALHHCCFDLELFQTFNRHSVCCNSLSQSRVHFEPLPAASNQLQHSHRIQVSRQNDKQTEESQGWTATIKIDDLSSPTLHWKYFTDVLQRPSRTVAAPPSGEVRLRGFDEQHEDDWWSPYQSQCSREKNSKITKAAKEPTLCCNDTFPTPTFGIPFNLTNRKKKVALASRFKS